MTPLEEARALVAKLFEAEQHLSAERLALDAQLARAMKGAGAARLAALLNGTEPSESSEVAALQAQAATLDAAIDAARAQRAAAIKATYQSEAAELREKAVAIRAEGARMAAEADRLHAQLAELEGVAFLPLAGPAPRVAAPEAIAALGYPMLRAPRSVSLRTLAQQVEQRALDLEAQPVLWAGLLHAADREELLSQIAANPFVIAPPLPALQAWLERAQEADRVRRFNLGPPHNQTTGRVVVQWTRAGIDEGLSTIR